jgi:hypothetical protein
MLQNLKLDQKVCSLRNILLLPAVESRLFMVSDRGRQGQNLLINDKSLAHPSQTVMSEIVFTEDKNDDLEQSMAILDTIHVNTQELLKVTKSTITFEGHDSDLIIMQRVNAEELESMGITWSCDLV